jgi:serine/threonine protein kinase/tetratricopeptide (TPR) repeat protein
MSELRPAIDDVFGAAIDLDSAEERTAYLERTCGGDAALRLRVQSLLDAHFGAGSFLEPPPAEQPTTAAISERPGTVIGPYKLLEQIGEGGFGIVFMAEQTHPVRRKVALKIVKPGMDTRQVIARFEAERQALALMEHPHIARVLDAGATETGRPYFVMELVRGVPITEFCDQSSLAVRDRLELFLAVCQAVQHAHQKGIIHRDIKPTNILITLHDGTPVVKVIDFGIAKAMGQQLTDKTLFTNFTQMLGTPLYMSPEQAEMSGLEVDTRSDIYSLGVLLYELLTGTTPFDKERLRTAAYDEIRRIIREEEPPRPSKRISTLGDALTTVSTQRNTDPARLSQLFRGDLDWIVMKALDKDRRRRYDSASAFAADILHHLHDEPVQACPPSSLYRFRKFARRNKLILVTAGLVALTLVTGSAASIWQAIRATAAESLAQERLRQAETDRVLAQQAEQKALTAVAEADKHRAQAEANLLETLKTVDDYFTRVSENTLLNVPGLQPLRKELLEAALRYYQGFVKQHAGDPKLRERLARAHGRLGHIHGVIGAKADAVAEYEKARELWQELRAGQPASPDYRTHLANTHVSIGYIEQERGLTAQAEAAYTAAIALLEPLTTERPERQDVWGGLSLAYHNLGYLHVQRKRFNEAQQCYEQALWLRVEQRQKRRNADLDRQVAQLYNDFAYLYLLKGDRNRSLHYNERALDIRLELMNQYPRVLEYAHVVGGSHNHIGDVYRAKRDWPAAVSAYERAIAIQEKLVRESPAVANYHTNLVNSYDNLAEVHNRAGRPADARRFYLAAVTQQEQLVRLGSRVADCDPDLLRLYDFLAKTEQKLGKKGDALPTYQRASRFLEEVIPEQPRAKVLRFALARIHLKVAAIHRHAQQWAEAVRACEAAIEWNPDNAATHNELAWLLATCSDVAVRDGPRAVKQAQRALALAADNGNYWNTLGAACYRAGDYKSAIAALDKSNTMTGERMLGHNSFFLAMSHWQLDDMQAARAWYAEATLWMDRNQERRTRMPFWEEELQRFRAEAAELIGVPLAPPAKDQSK